MSKSNYILQETEKSFCPECNSKVKILCDKDDMISKPSFYFCGRCPYISEIGKGPVPTWPCNCGNPNYGFNCVCDHVKENPGDEEYACEFCGIYKASKPKCNKCEEG